MKERFLLVKNSLINWHLECNDIGILNGKLWIQSCSTDLVIGTCCILMTWTYVINIFSSVLHPTLAITKSVSTPENYKRTWKFWQILVWKFQFVSNKKPDNKWTIELKNVKWLKKVTQLQKTRINNLKNIMSLNLRTKLKLLGDR
jgi:hypothetical protein